MSYYIDYAYNSINKIGEELCGDNVEFVEKEDGIIIVLADGLGSGVKANILATMTSKIAVTMLKEGLSIEETIETIANTLPVCARRNLAYSTFTILDIKNTGDVYMVEYENPPSFIYRLGKKFDILKKERIVNNKKIQEGYFKMRKGDSIIAISDGVIHAGVGELLNLGWQWENVNEYLENLVKFEKSAISLSKGLLEVCENLYDQKPGDDTTVLAVLLRERTYANIFTGPPKSKANDIKLIEKIKNSKNYTIIAGGTTSNIVARELGLEVEVDIDSYNSDLPPMGYIKGISLVTEGLLTLSRVVKILKEKEDYSKINDGAGRMLSLIDRSTNVNIYLGKAVNIAHQNPAFPEEFNLKIQVVKELRKELLSLGKTVTIEEI